MQKLAPSETEQSKAYECLDRASAYLDSDNLDSALAECATALHLAPNAAVAHNLHGVILEEAGRVEEALAAYREAARLDPNLVEAHLNLAELGEAVLRSRAALARRSPAPSRLQIGLGIMGVLLLLIASFLVLRGLGLLPGERLSAPVSTGPMLVSGSDRWRLIATVLSTNTSALDNDAFPAGPGTILLLAEFECVTQRSPLDILFTEDPSTVEHQNPASIEDGPVINLGPKDGCYSIYLAGGIPNAYVTDSDGKQYPVMKVAVHCRGAVPETFTLEALVHEDAYSFSLHFADMPPITLGR
jgi:hypothetical protein